MPFSKPVGARGDVALRSKEMQVGLAAVYGSVAKAGSSKYSLDERSRLGRVYGEHGLTAS